MSAQSKITFKAIVKVARESGALDKEITKIENKVIDKGLELIEEAGIDPTLLPIDVRALLRGETPRVDTSKLLAPEVICAMPQLTPQQKETTTRTINNAREEVENIFTTTNAIKEQTMALTLPIISLQQSASSVATTVESISTLLEVLKKLAVPTASPPGVGIPTGVLNTFSSTIGSLSDLIKAAAVDIRVIPNALGIMTATINTTITGLNGLNQVLDPFLKVLTMVKSVVDLQDQCPLLDQSDINNVQSLLLSNITGNLAQADLFSGLGDGLEESLQPNSPNPFFYKSFRFTLENEDPNPYSFPSRRIRCERQNSIGFTDFETKPIGSNERAKTIPGGGKVIIYNINELTNPTLDVGAYSYASSIPVLVAEGKFAVDTYTNNIKLFSAPVFRENVEKISGNFQYVWDLTGAELENALTQLGFNSLEELLDSEYAGAQALPSFIVYGGTRVNLNSSPTDVEYGADALVQDGSYTGGTGISLSSYIQSGTIQVNQPINLRLQTFGGTGNPVPNPGGNPNPTPRFTESLLTIKRSAAIQDDVNPFTGRIEGFGDDGAVKEFVEEYGQGALEILGNVYATAEEITGEFSSNPDVSPLANLSFIDRLKYVYDTWFGVNGETQRDKSNANRNRIDTLFTKSQQLLYNENVLWLSKRLFGNKDENANIRTEKFKNTVLRLDGKIASDIAIGQDLSYGFYNDLDGDGAYSSGEGVSINTVNKAYATTNENWYWTARLNSSSEELNRAVSGRGNAKAATLGMLYFGLRQFVAKYIELYGDRTEYNNGAWISPSSGLPLIPGNVGPDNEDIIVALQETQIAGVNQEINQIVGSLDILGTYTYDLEIIDSIPAIGGPDTNYPTNYTFLTVEDIIK